MSDNESAPIKRNLAARFRGFLPVIVDVETAGFDPEKNALLEIAAIPVQMNEQGLLEPQASIACHVEPFPGSKLDQRALDFTGIDPFHPFRFAKPEAKALQYIFDPIRQQLNKQGCTRAILVGHNAFFDLGFVKAAAERCKIKKNPFHSFSAFDTATLAGLAYGQTVLSRAVEAAGYSWNEKEAHSAIYDAEKTAQLFCAIVNKWDQLVGMPDQEETRSD